MNTANAMSLLAAASILGSELGNHSYYFKGKKQKISKSKRLARKAQKQARKKQRK